MPEVFTLRVKRVAAALVSSALILISPGLEAWAAAGKMFSGSATPMGVSLPGTPLAPQVNVPAAATNTGLPGGAIPAIPALPSTPLSAPAPSAALPAAVPAPSAAAPRAMAAGPQTPGGSAPSAAQPSGENLSASGAQKFDHAAAARDNTADAVEAPEWSSPVPTDLKLKPADSEKVSQWMSDFHAKLSQDYPQYEFTVRDFYAWARFVRFYTPSLGIKEAVTRGAAYVYRDRFESASEAAAFDSALPGAARSLAVSDPGHGKDAKLAKELLALAEPKAHEYRADESSPYQVPVSALIPDAKTSDLVMTATTLKRIEAASQAFALRDFALLLGPPATEKSAIPKYLASQHKIPYLAVTMHPGIGVFELVGGYRPRVARAGSLKDAAASVAAALTKAEKGGDYNDLLEAAAKVYGGKPMADVLAAIRADLAGEALETLAETERARRLTTLSYALEHGAQSLVWQDGYLTYAIKNDIWITFEELNAAPTETQEFLNEFMRSRRLAVTQKLGETEVMSPRPGGRFMLWATMNPETDSNREVLAQTLKNRWRIKYFGHLPAIETAEIIEKKFGMPTVWALSLVENFHRELDRQARERVIGGSWRDGYEINLRQLLRTAKRWRYFVDQEAKASKGGAVPEARQRVLLAREAYSLYGGMMRTANERAGVYRMLDQALSLHGAGVRSADDLTVQPAAIEDLGDSLRIGDVTLAKGAGGPFVPKPSKDYLADKVVLARLYEYAKALALGEPLLLMGDSAAGKTSDLEYLFFRLNRNLRYKNLDSDTAIEEVIGGFAPGDRKGTFTFQEGLVPKAMEEHSGAFLDEFNLNPLVEWLNTVIDDGKLYLPHRIVDGRAMIVAAANPPDPRYPGRILLSAATRSRYTERWVDIDKSPSRLSQLMGHWLKGGAVYALAAAFLPALSALHNLAGLSGGSFALGSAAAKRSIVPGLLLTGAATAALFVAVFANFNSPLVLPVVPVAFAGIVMMAKARQAERERPRVPADVAMTPADLSLMPRTAAGDALERAAAAAAALSAKGDLPSRLRAQALSEKAAEVRSAAGSADQGIALRQLEDLLRAPVAGAGGSAALGSYQKQDGFPWLLLSIAGTAYFFIAAATHFGNPIGFFAAIITVWTGILMGDKARRRGREMPLDAADVKALRAQFYESRGKTQAGPNKAPWTKADLAKLVAPSHAVRLEGIRWLESFPGDDEAVKLLERLALAETTPVNVIMAVKAIGQSQAPEALPALKRLQAKLPGDFTIQLQQVLAKVQAGQASAPQVAELVELAAAPKAPTQTEAALARAVAAAGFLEAKGDLASRLRAQALREKAAELKAASGDAAAITLRQLEDLLAAPFAGDKGSAAFGRRPVLAPVAGIAKLWGWLRRAPGPDLDSAQVAALKAMGASLPDSPARHKAGKKQLGAYFDFSGGYTSYGMTEYDGSSYEDYSQQGERASRVAEVVKEFPGSDDAVLMLEKLIEHERTPDVVKNALTGIGDINAPQSPAVLKRLASKLDVEFQPYVSDALAKTQTGVTVPRAAALPTAAAPLAPAYQSTLVERAQAAAAAADDGTLAGRLKAAAIREKAALVQTALDAAGVASRQLEDLLAPRAGVADGSAAFDRGWLERLKGAFGSKKKVPEGVEGPAAGPKADEDAPARAPTLEELLRSRGVPEKDWPAVRAKVDRVQTIIQMVGGSVGRDESTRWAPGDLWAFFPDENKVTYPFEDLLTHSEEEIVGLTDHEGGHRDITALDQRLPLVKKYFGDPLKHFLWNGFEDPRVNNWDIKRMPGAARYLHAAYDRYLPEDLEAKPTNEAPDLSAPQGDGASAFNPEALQYPHVEFIMAGNYYWRYGKKPPKFHNKSAEKAFDEALPEIEKIFKNYPQRTDPDQKEREAYSYDTLKRIDEKLLPLYEPLVAESQKKMAKQMSGKGKGKGKNQGQSQNDKGKGKQGSGAMPPQSQQQKPGEGKPGDEKKDDKKDQKGGGDEEKDPKDEKPDPKALKEALEKLREHAEKAAEELGSKIEDQPTNKDVREALEKKGLTAGGDAPKPLTLQDIAQTQREQLVNRQASAFDRAFAPVAHLSGAMVTHLENIFQKNARPRDEGWYRTGKRPDVKQFMKRQGEGGLRDDYMLRRAARTKRKYKVTLLIDASGSMREHAVEASRTAVLLAESLTRLQIDVEIILFSNVARVVKSFEQPMTPQNRDAIAEDFRALIGSLGNGMTHDADALKQSLDRLRAQDGDRKFVFVVTDGAGNGPSKLSDALAQAARDRVFVMGVGIGAGMASYVKANYPRHAVVDTVDALPLKLKEELERYIGEQEMSPRPAQSFVPQGQGNAQGSSALGSPYPSFALQTLSLAVALGTALALLGAVSLAPWPFGNFIGVFLVGGLMAASRRWGFWLVEAAYLSAASTVFYFLLGHGGRWSALWAALIIAPAALKVFGSRLAAHFAPLDPELTAEVKAALSGTRGADGLVAWKPRRLRTVFEVASETGPRFIDALSFLAERDPDETVRGAAVEALAGQAADIDEALEGLGRAAAAGGAAGVLAQRRLDRALRARAGASAEKRTIDLENLAVPAAPASAENGVAARARVFLGAPEEGGLAGRLRRAALEEALRQLESASGDEAAVAERRLQDLLDGKGTAAGSQALPGLPAPRGGWRLFFERRVPIGLLGWLTVARWSLLYTTGALAVASFAPFLKPMAGVLMIGGLFAFFGSGKGPRAYLFVRAGIFAFLTAMFFGTQATHVTWVAWIAFNMLALVGSVEKLVPTIIENWGAPGRAARWTVLRSGPKSLTARQKWWRRALAGSTNARDAAALEMLGAPSEVPALEPALLMLARQAPEKLTPEVVEVMARLRTLEADAALKRVSMMKSIKPVPAAKWAEEALAKRKEADEAPLPSLVEPARPDAETTTLAAARAELAKPAQTLSERLRAQALSEAVTAVETSSGDERRLALERLTSLLSDAAGAGAGAAALGASARFPRALTFHVRHFFNDSGRVSILLNALWLGGSVAGAVFGGMSGAIYGASSGFFAAIALVLAEVFGFSRYKTAAVPAQSEAAALEAYRAWPADERARLEDALSGPQEPSVGHSFLKLVHPVVFYRQEAWKKAWALLSARPALAAPLLGSVLSSPDRRLGARTTREDLERLAELGAPGRAQLEKLLEPATGAGFDGEEQAAARALLARSLDATARSLDLSALEKPADAGETILGEARALLARPAVTLSDRLRRKAVEEALADVSAAPADLRAAALDRLESLLAERPRSPDEGSQAAASRGLRPRLWGALAAGALALSLAAAPVWLALSAVSPVLAAGAGVVSGAALLRSLTRPLGFRDARVALGPREESAALPEWIPAQRALKGLAGSLGVAAEDAPSFGLWTDAPGSAEPSWNGWSGGLGVNAKSVIAVGERWLTASELELRGLLGHELGHLATGEQRWRNVWARVQEAGRWAVLAAVVAAPAAGWLWAALAAGAWLSAGLLGLAWLRRAELRADRFSATVAGREAALAFLRRVAQEEPRLPRAAATLLSWLSDHPTAARRLAAVYGAGAKDVSAASNAGRP